MSCLVAAYVFQGYGPLVVQQVTYGTGEEGFENVTLHKTGAASCPKPTKENRRI
jgi:hypothetical protein